MIAGSQVAACNKKAEDLTLRHDRSAGIISNNVNTTEKHFLFEICTTIQEDLKGGTDSRVCRSVF